MSSARAGDRGGPRGPRRAGFGGRGTNASDSEGSSRGSGRRGRGAVRNSGTARSRGASAGSRQRNLGPQQASHASKAAASKPDPLPLPKPSMEGLSWAQRYQTLKANRDQERKHAIAAGLIADPDKPRKLADAITIVGTCQDMCGEFERAERVYQNDVWELEYEPGTTEPAEHRMVKKFRRAAAGVEEQLPSDLRPPEILRRTCDYLFDQVLSETSLGQAHHFLWDRTRAIRNDFSIQQCTKIPDVRVQIECLERIARFHIISMHQLATEKKPYDAYDNFQDREQLDKTLLTLMELYDANRSRYRSPNEGEFRAYCILFEMKSLVPNIEDRIQSWESDLIKNPQVRKAVRLFNSACDTIRPVGPLNPRISHPIAQGNSARFFRIIESPEVSYLMACVSEIEFKSVREATLNGIWQAYRTGGNTRTEDWTLAEVTRVLAFDDDEETRSFCEAYGFVIDERRDGIEFLDLTSVQGKNFPAAAASLRKQFRSQNLVEPKRWNRSLSAVINGLTVQEATERGLIVEDAMIPEKRPPKESSLFVSQQESDTETESAAASSFAPPAHPFVQGVASLSRATESAPAFPFSTPAEGASAFGKPAGSSAFSFGKPAEGASSFGPPSNSSIFSKPAEGSSFGQPMDSSSPFSKPTVSGGNSVFGKPAATGPFSFGKPADTSKPTDSPLGQPADTPSTNDTPAFSFGKPAEAAEKSRFPATSPFGQPAAAQSMFSKPAIHESPFSKPPGPFTELAKETEPEYKPSAPASTSAFPAQSAFSLDKTPSTTLSPLASIAGSSPFGASTNSTTQDESRPFGFANMGQPSSTAQTPGTATPPGSPPKSTPFDVPASGASFPSSESEAKNPFGFTTSQLSGASGFQFKPSTSKFPPAPETTPTSTTINPPQASSGLFNPTKQSPNLGSFEPRPRRSSQPPFEPPTFPHGGFSNQDSQPSPPKFSPGGPSTKSSEPLKTTTFPPAPTPPKTPLPPATTPNEPQVKFAPDRKEEKSRAYQRITENLVLEPTSGLLTQFIEHKAEEIIRNAIRQFQEEQEEELARQFRASKLSIRYVQLWKESCAAARHKRRARERRKARRSAVISASRGTRESRIENDVQDFKNTMAASTMRRSASRESDRNRFKDSFRSSIGIADIMARQKRSMDPPPRPPSTASERRASSTLSERKSASHYSSRALAPQNEDLGVSKAPARYRASFLAGEPLLPPDSTYDGRISTTKTDYFRLRAMGINPDDVYPNRRKRVHDAVSEDVESFASRSTTPPDRKKRAFSREQPTATPSSVSRADDADANDPLVAKCRSLTKSFMDDINALRSLREENERESRRLSQSSMDDPLARSYSDFRSSHFGKSRAAAPVPASTSLPKYWGRQSKFLPRSEYGGARWLTNKSTDKGSGTEPSRRPEPVADNKSLFRPNAASDNYSSRVNMGSPQPPGSTAMSRNILRGTLPQPAQSNRRASGANIKSNGLPAAHESDVILLSSKDEEEEKPRKNAEESLSDDDGPEEEDELEDDDLSEYAQGMRQRERRSAAEDDFYLTGSDEVQDADDEIDDVALVDEVDDEYESGGVGDDDDEGYSEQMEGQEDEQGADEDEEEDEDEDEDPPAPSKYRDAGNSIEDAIEL